MTRNELENMTKENVAKVAKDLGVKRYKGKSMLSKKELIDGICKVMESNDDAADAQKAINKIAPRKDVDGLTTINNGLLATGQNGFIPCTAAGCMEMIRSTGIDIAGKNAVVIGRSNIVGKPVAIQLLKENATVTICHSHTIRLKEICQKADILIVAVGKKNFVTADMIKPGAIVIDVGINVQENGKLCGDVDFNEAKEVAGYITPVPGGVGLMTRAMLMKNILEATKCQLIKDI